jgi:preprotein translocase subunit YajC
MPPELLYPLIASAVVMLVFYLYLLLLRLQTEKRRETLNQLLAEIQN